MKKLRLFTTLISVAFSSLAYTAGPSKVATLDRTLWPHNIDTRHSYNEASRAEISQFAHQLDAIDLSSIESIQTFTGIEAPYTTQVDEWVQTTKDRLLSNYQAACTRCKNVSWETITTLKVEWNDTPYKAWSDASRSFHKRYLYEQVRLAALFPRVSSEIGTFDTKLEIDGHSFADGEFLLTYDDGPSPTRTAPLISALEENDLNATFFVLGDQLEKVRPARDTYKRQCLASHGYAHKSHQRWDDWKSSLDKTRALLQHYKQEKHFWFRPPYGQRHGPLVTSLKDTGEKVMLWNIDSQDWNRKLSNHDVQDRVITLMMLWRKGIILYHDIHPKALENLIPLKEFTTDAELRFVNCEAIKL